VAIAANRLTIRGTARVGGRKVTQTATNGPGRDTLLLGLGPKAPSKLTGSYDLRLAPRGGRLRRKYKIERGRSAGPAQVGLAARPGRTVEVAVKVRRSKGLVGAVRVELGRPEQVGGVSAEPIVLPAGRSEGALTVRFGPGPLGPFNAPLMVRATLVEPTGPV